MSETVRGCGIAEPFSASGCEGVGFPRGGIGFLIASLTTSLLFVCLSLRPSHQRIRSESLFIPNFFGLDQKHGSRRIAWLLHLHLWNIWRRPMPPLFTSVFYYLERVVNLKQCRTFSRPRCNNWCDPRNERL